MSGTDYALSARAMDRLAAMPAARKLRALLVVLLLISIVPPLAGLAHATSGAQYPIQQVDGGDRYFSPDGDGQEDTLDVQYYLGAAATVSWTITDAGGATVKTAAGQSEPAFQWQTIHLDGSSDTGTLPAGQYTLNITGTTASNLTGTTLVAFGITRGPIAHLTAPTAGQTIAGTSVPASLVTDTGLPSGASITYAYMQSTVNGDSSYLSSSINSSTLTGTFDTTQAIDGDNLLSASVDWTDPLGGGHAYSTPGVSVTVDNPIRLTSVPSDHYIAAGVTGEDNHFYYTLSRDATVTMSVADSNGNVVATPIDHAAQTRGSQSPTWDLNDSAGNPVPQGVYDVTITAVDSANRSDSKTFKLGIWRGGLGSMSLTPATSPVSGDLAGSFSATLPPGSALQSVSYNGTTADNAHSFYGYANGAPWDATMHTAPQWSGYGYYDGTADGQYDVTAQVGWLDPLGGYHGDTSDSTPVTVSNDVQVHAYNNTPVWLTPGADGTLPAWSGNVAISEPTDLTFDVKNASGDVVDSGTADGSSPYGSAEIDWTPPAGTADGVYDVVVTATDSTTQHTSQATLQLGIDTRSPGTISEPVSMVAGNDLVFTPADGVTPQYVAFYLDGNHYVGYASPADDGTWHYTLQDYDIPALGDHTLRAEVGINESPFGSATLDSPSVDLTVSNSGTITGLTAGSSWFDPALSDGVSLDYTLDSPGTVAIDLLDGQDQLVAPLAGGIAARGGSNSFYWDGTDSSGTAVPAGAYHVRVTSTGGDQTVTSKAVAVSLSRDLPGQMTLPAANDVLAGSVGYEFRPTAGFGVDAVQFCLVQQSTNTSAGCTAVNAADDDGAFRATRSLTHVPQGAYSAYLQAHFVDPNGNSRYWTSPTVPVEVQALQLPLSVTAPASGPAPLAAAISFSTSHPDGVDLTYDVDFGDGSAHATGTVSSPYPIVALNHTYTSRGTYNGTVTVSDGAGDTTTKPFTATVVNRPPTGTLTVTPLKVVVGSAVTAALTGTDPDNDPMTYGVTWGDNSSTGSQPLPDGATSVTHTYTTPGVYTVSYVLGDGYVQGGVRIGATTVIVQSDQPPVADPGDPPANALATVPVNFDGSSSTPVDGITSYHWDFGDGASSDQAAPAHTYDNEGAYTATLTVSVGDRTDSKSIPVAVGPKPKGDGLKVTVTGGGHTLSGALVTYLDPNGSRQTVYTGGDGIATIHGLPDGVYSIDAAQMPYRPGQASATVTNDNGQVTIDLVNGDFGAVTLDSHEMSLDEIKAAGINPDDPANKFVFSFNIKLAFSVQPNQPPQQQDFQGFANTDGFTGDTGYSGGQGQCIGACPLDLGDGYQATPQPDFSDPKKPTIIWLVAPVNGSMLKEFFDVQMVVTNLIPGDFPMQGTATLNISQPGLTVMNVDGAANTTQVPPCVDGQTTNCMADIPGTASERVRWVLRGDEVNDYSVWATYQGTVEPVGLPVDLKTQSVPIKVWGASGLQFTVHVQDQAYQNLPYDISVEVKNITPGTTFYNLGLSLQSGQHYTFAPGLKQDQQTDALAPDQTWIADWQVIPDITGAIDLSQSVVERVSGGDATKPDKVVTDPAKNTPESTPQLHAVADGDNVDLNWDSITDASEYRIYATDDLGNGFISDPLSTLSGTSVTVPRYAPQPTLARPLSNALMLHPLAKNAMTTSATPADTVGSTLHYAVMTEAQGKLSLRHNIADVLDGFSCPSADQPAPSVKIGPWALTGCIKHVSGPGVTSDTDDDVWVARQNATLNGLTLVPTTATGEIRFNLTKQSLTASVPVRASLKLPDVAGVSVPPIKLFEMQPAWDLSATDVPLTLSLPKFLGLPIAAQATLSATADGAADVNATVTPPAILGGKPTAVKFHADNAGGLHLDSLDVNLSNPGIGTLIGLDTAHLKYDGTQWTLDASGKGGETATGNVKYNDDGSFGTGHLVVTNASIGGLFTINALTLDATGDEHWTGSAQASLSDGSSANVSFDLGYASGKLSTATVTAPRILMKGLFEITDATFKWSAATSTWTIAGTATVAGGTPTSVNGKLVVPDGTITQGELHASGLTLGGFGTLTQLDLTYNSTDSSWSGNAAFAMPGSANAALHLSVTVVNGVLTQAHADVGQATVAGLLTTKNAAFDYVSDPGTWQLTADEASLGNLIAVKNLKVLDDVGKSSWQLSGTVDAAGSTATINAQLTYDKGDLSTGTFNLADVNLGGLVQIDNASLTYNKATATWAADAQAGSASMNFTVVNGVLQSGHVSVPSAKIAGVIDLTDFTVDYDGSTGQWGGGGTAAIPGNDAGKLTVSFAYADGKLVGGSLQGSASFMNALTINDISLAYDQTADQWSGGAKITLPGPNGTQVGGKFVFQHGKFVSGTATVTNVPLTTGIDLREFDLSIDTQPALKLAGQATLATTQFPGLNTDAVSVTGNLSYTFSDPGQWHADGTFKLVDFPLANAHLDYVTGGKATFGGSLDAGLSGIANVHAGLDGSIGPDGISASGDASVSVLNLAGASGKVLVDNHGIAGCAQLHVGWTWDAGVVYPWGGTAHAIGSTCDLSSWEAANAAAPAPAGQTSNTSVTHAERRTAGVFTALRQVRPAIHAMVTASAAVQVPSAVTVPDHLPVFALSFAGASAPSVTLTDPDGNTYPSTDGVHDGPGNGYAVTHDATTTYFMLNAPMAGVWTVTVDPGSPQVTDVQQAQALPQPNVTATVAGSGDQRTLSWSLTPIPGQVVTFIADDGATSQTLATTSAASGTATFAPAPGPAGTRTVRAVVTQDGFPRTEFAGLDTFDVADTTPIAVTVTRGGNGSGTVTSAPNGINCGTSCTWLFAAGHDVTLTAAPAAGSTFTGWAGACSGTTPTCTLTPAGDEAVTATFTSVGAGGGSPTPTPSATGSPTPTPSSTSTPTATPTPTPSTGLIPTAITIAANRSAVTVGNPVILSGRLTRADNGAPLVSRTVTVWRLTAHGWARFAAVTTDGHGRWRRTVRPRYTTSYTVAFARTATEATSVAHATVVKVHARVLWDGATTRTTTSQLVHLTGRVLPNHAADRVVLWVVSSTGAETRMASIALDKHSRFAFDVSIAPNSTRRFAVSLPGDDRNLAAGSVPLTVTRP